MDTARETNKQIPKPGQLENKYGKWVQRIPKSIHLRLVNRAKEEGVSLNTLVITMLAESLGGESHSTKEREPQIAKASSDRQKEHHH